MDAAGGVEAGCPPGVPGGTIGLAEAVARALCYDPRTRQTWAQARASAAQLGIERAGYLPEVSAGLELSRDRLRIREDGSESRIAETAESGAVELTWMLFDFGQRDAAVQGARHTLLAATATHDATMQRVFLDTSNAFFTLLAAQSELAIAREVEQFSEQIVREAEEVLKDEDVDLAEKLQARTAVAEATLDRGRAEGALRLAQGQLAILLGHGPDIAVDIAAEDEPPPDLGFVQLIQELLRQAQAAHPAIRAARLRLDAARASADSARRAYRPTLGLAYGNRRFNEIPDARVRENSLSLQLSIPLFDGFARNYREREALAQVDAASSEVSEVEQTVALEVWEAFHTLETETRVMIDATRLLELSSELLQAEQTLFREGEGDMLDLLSAQSSKAGASLEQLQSKANLRAARLRLAASLGRLGFWTLRRP
nr:TolC family protein [Methylibium sp.]